MCVCMRWRTAPETQKMRQLFVTGRVRQLQYKAQPLITYHELAACETRAWEAYCESALYS